MLHPRPQRHYSPSPLSGSHPRVHGQGRAKQQVVQAHNGMAVRLPQEGVCPAAGWVALKVLVQGNKLVTKKTDTV